MNYPTTLEIVNGLTGKSWDYNKYGAPGYEAVNLIRRLERHINSLECEVKELENLIEELT